MQPGMAAQMPQILETTGGEVIQYVHILVALDKRIDQMRPDEPCSSCDKYVHSNPPARGFERRNRGPYHVG